MVFAKWSERSLRSWVAIGMTITLMPPAISAVLDHVILSRGVIADFQDVARRYRDEIGPTQKLRLTLSEVGDPVNEYLGEHEVRQVDTYRALRIRIEEDFARLHQQFGSDAKIVSLLGRAQDDWSVADRLASDLFSGAHAHADSDADALVDKFDGLIGSADDKLEALVNDLDLDLDQDHTAALRSYEHIEWVAGICAGASLLMMVLGIFGIGRIVVVNVERLIDGARKFADGDRTHRIAVQVPPELRRVADEFNRMVERIHESEAALAEEAREDALTGLANRRAFDEALEDAFARMRRLGQRVVLLLLDIDHFKKINDTHGHAGGDAVLRGVGQMMTASIREIDKAFRIGGEELAVLMVETDLVGAEVAAERLRVAIAGHRVTTNQVEVAVTTSIGVAFANKAMHPSELVKAADEALYRAKSSGRNRVVISSEAGVAKADAL